MPIKSVELATVKAILPDFEPLIKFALYKSPTNPYVKNQIVFKIHLTRNTGIPTTFNTQAKNLLRI